MPSRLLIRFGLLFNLLFSSVVTAGMENARFALHRVDPPSKIGSLCSTYTPNYNGIPCVDYTVTGPAPGASIVYLVIGQGGTEGIAAVSFGIDYDGRAGEHMGIDPTTVTWNSCVSSAEYKNDGGFGPWPNPKGGVRMSWSRLTHCQTEVIGSYGVHALLGWFYLYAYSEDILRLTPNNNLESGSELIVCNCDDPDIVNPCTNLLGLYPPQLHDFLTGRVHFGGDGSPGYTPCGVTRSQATTWGKLKKTYD